MPRVRIPAFVPAAGLLLSVAAAVLLPGVASSGNGDCGQPVSNGSGPSASDCSYVLRSSVGSVSCALCVCDLNGSLSVTAADGLVCLRKAVGQAVDMACPDCSVTTTTTSSTTTTTKPSGGGPTTSTTSTSTTSTTTTLPVLCSSNAQCSALPSPFRCNPHTDTCEKPCRRNTDCKDFYVCNRTTEYCEEPAALF